MKNSKTNSIALVILAIIVAIVGAFYFYQKNQIESQLVVVNQQPAVTSPKGSIKVTMGTSTPANLTLETYKNTQFGFSFDYPNTLLLSESLLPVSNTTGKGIRINFPPSTFINSYIQGASIDIVVSSGKQTPPDTYSILNINGQNWVKMDVQGTNRADSTFYRRVTYAIYGTSATQPIQNIAFNLNITSSNSDGLTSVGAGKLISTFENIVKSYKISSK